MAKGTKLSLNIGAHFDEGWKEVQTQKSPTRSSEILLPQKHFLHFKKEKRRGKVLTLVGVFQLKDEDASALVKKIKKALGTGGTYKDGYMEFQGELQDKLRVQLEKMDFRFKK